MGWHNHILSLCDGDDAEALRLFFDLYHEFFFSRQIAIFGAANDLLSSVSVAS
jgi:hypothetical protein